MSLALRPISQRDARLFIAGLHPENRDGKHRHNHPPSVFIFQVGVETQEGKLVAVAIGALPRARMLMDGRTLEIIRVSSDGTRNACSMLYGACCRAAEGLGYRRIVTYTLASERGSSLRASGFVADEEILDHNPKGWDSHPQNRSPSVDLFGNRSTPDEPKRRWWRMVGGKA